jgi:hypothetical protein
VVISQPLGVVVELSAIVKIRKYIRFHQGHHFILMVVDMNDTHGCDMDRFIGECSHLFYGRRSRDHLSLSFYIQFFK